MKTLDDGHSYIGWLFNEEVIGSNPTSFLVVVFAILGRFLVYFRLFKQALKFLKQIDVKFFYDHPVYGARIRTHDLWSLLP